MVTVATLNGKIADGKRQESRQQSIKEPRPLLWIPVGNLISSENKIFCKNTPTPHMIGINCLLFNTLNM
jgi:hypothetical protein